MKTAGRASFEVGYLRYKEATVTEFPGFVLVENFTSSVEDNCQFALRTEDFAKLHRKWKGTDFLFEPFAISPDMYYRAVTSSYLNDYIARPQWVSDAEFDEADIRSYVEHNKFQNIVRGYTVDDGYLYDLNGDPVYRSFRVALGSNDFAAQSVYSHLKRNKKVQGLGIEKVPFYNHDCVGDCQVEFNYYSDPNEFYELHKINLEDAILGTRYAIAERLELEPFKTTD